MKTAEINSRDPSSPTPPLPLGLQKSSASPRRLRRGTSRFLIVQRASRTVTLSIVAGAANGGRVRRRSFQRTGIRTPGRCRSSKAGLRKRSRSRILCPILRNHPIPIGRHSFKQHPDPCYCSARFGHTCPIWMPRAGSAQTPQCDIGQRSRGQRSSAVTAVEPLLSSSAKGWKRAGSASSFPLTRPILKSAPLRHGEHHQLTRSIRDSDFLKTQK
jgi:hypothetical protein